MDINSTETYDQKVQNIFRLLREGISYKKSDGTSYRFGESPVRDIIEFILYEDLSRKAKVIWMVLSNLFYHRRLDNPFRFSYELCEEVRQYFPVLHYSDKTVRAALRELVRKQYLTKPRRVLYKMPEAQYKLIKPIG
ncbi:MAG: hypothetical protein OEY18_08180 [Candidatus Aminicenantes bacterium]|nr:hypothetical protein [Candidatus Aminicenantes bacterium]MDH5384669.1 hypothetical protein [Candidatus Aminicenantes bacterium]MDH5743043.1 hypothetical protein [Candidatus Aminicenantes bacterium]